MRQMTVDRAESIAKQIAERREPTCFIAPNGVGSTMVARRVPRYLPPPSALENAWIAAEFEAAGLVLSATPDGGLLLGALPDGEPLRRPFRAPHHTVSAAGLIGAVQKKHAIACAALREPLSGPCDCKQERVFRPGEAQLARFGVLLLDELPEFSRATIVALEGALHRMGATQPLVLTTALPCPCGRYGTERHHECTCPGVVVDRYAARVRDFTNILKLTVKNLE